MLHCYTTYVSNNKKNWKISISSSTGLFGRTNHTSPNNNKIYLVPKNLYITLRLPHTNNHSNAFTPLPPEINKNIWRVRRDKKTSVQRLSASRAVRSRDFSSFHAKQYRN